MILNHVAGITRSIWKIICCAFCHQKESKNAPRRWGVGVERGENVWVFGRYKRACGGVMRGFECYLFLKKYISSVRNLSCYYSLFEIFFIPPFPSRSVWYFVFSQSLFLRCLLIQKLYPRQFCPSYPPTTRCLSAIVSLVTGFCPKTGRAIWHNSCG